MHPLAFKHTLIATAVIAVHSTSAQPLPVGEFDTGGVLRMPAPTTVATVALDMNRIVGTQTMLIRLQATEYQRKIAEARARAFVSAQRSAPVEPSSSTKSAADPKKPKPKAPQVAVQPKKKLPRYLAVETVKDKRSAPDVKKVIMIWDTQSESLVSNDLHEVKSPPPTGSMAKFETYSAEYIGAGL